MARITLRQLLDHAAEHGYGVPAFNINNMEQGLAIMDAAAAVEGGWPRWLGDDGEFVGMTGFGASAPAETLYREFGITAEETAKAALRCIARSRMAATYA